MNKDLNKYIEDINRIINISMEEIKESAENYRKLAKMLGCTFTELEKQELMKKILEGE